MKTTAYLPAALLLILLSPSPAVLADALSDEEELALIYGGQPSVSIATGTQQTLSRAPAVATVITAEDIAAMGATNLDEVMETVPGMHVARSNVGNAALYIMRGIYNANNPQILMLQNGIPMTTMFQGNKGGVWGGLPLENVARIEIIRGPGSALYGADAYSGVINVITKTAAEADGTQFGVRAGSFNTKDAWVLHGGKLGPVDVAAYLRLGNTDGSREIISADYQTLLDKARGTHASLAPGPMSLGQRSTDASLDLSYEKWRFRAGYKLRDDVGVGAGVASALDPNSRAKSERITADLSWIDANFARNWGLGATASYMEYNDTIPTNIYLFPPGAKLGPAATAYFPNGVIGGPNKWERQTRLSAYATYSGFTDHSLRFGIGRDNLDLYRTVTYKNYFLNQTTGAYRWTGPVIDYTNIQPFMTPHVRLVDYAYLQDEWRLARDWTLTAGVRRDTYSDVGSTTNPRLALVWDASLNVTVKLLAGHAFRAPSFNELYGINNPVFKGNPALKPEKNRTEEAAVSWQARKDLRLNMNIFQYKMEDIIQPIKDSPTSTFNTYRNSGVQRGKGGEIEAVWDVNHQLRLTANYSNQRSINEATNTDAGYAPHEHLYVRSDWRFRDGWSASAQANWVIDRKRASGDWRADVPDYTTVDLTVRTERSKKGEWEFAGSIRNLFNSQVLEPTQPSGTLVPLPNDLPQPRRSFYLQAAYSL